MYVEKRSTNIADISEMRITPSLVDLCVKTVVQNLRYLGDVGETDSHLLERILPHCTIDQLLHVEMSTKVSCLALFMPQLDVFPSVSIYI